MTETCPDCGGDGIVAILSRLWGKPSCPAPYIGERICYECRGKGAVSKPCPACNGSGLDPDKSGRLCPKCGGKG